MSRSTKKQNTARYTETKQEEFDEIGIDDHDDEGLYGVVAMDTTISDDEDDVCPSTPSAADKRRQTQTRCSNLPIVAWCRRWKCCFFCEGTKKYNVLFNENDSQHKRKSTTEKAQDALIYEECLDQTGNKLVENCAWVNATIFSLALRATVFYDFGNDDDIVNQCRNYWIYMAVIFCIAVVSLFVPLICCVKTDSLRTELQSIKEDSAHAQQGSIVLSSVQTSLGLSEIPQSEEEKKIRMEMKIFYFVEHEAKDVAEKFEALWSASLSNAVAMGWRDAAQSTLMVIVGDTALGATVLFLYAVVMTVVGIYIVLRLDRFYQNKQKQIIGYLENSNDGNTVKSEQKRLQRFAFLKRTISLVNNAFKFGIAWAWRNSINAFIWEVYGHPDDEDILDPVMHQWGYTIMLSLFVAVLLGINDDYYIVYPRNQQSQQHFDSNSSRIVTNSIIYDNLRFVVGMSWFDSIMVTIGVSNLQGNRLAGTYWVIALSGIILSVVGTHYMTKFELSKEIQYKGLAQAMFDTFERFYDPNGQLHSEDGRDMVPAIVDNTVFELIVVSIDGWGVAGSLSLINAITYTVYIAVPGFGEVSTLGPNLNYQVIVEDEENIYVLWVTAFICLMITLALTAYVARLLNAIKRARRTLFKRMFAHQKKELKRLTAMRAMRGPTGVNVP